MKITKTQLEDETMDGFEKCIDCRGLIITPGPSPDGRCFDCREAHDDDEAICLNKNVRCPACRNYFDPHASEYYTLLEYGDHDVICPECDYEFEIETNIEWSFDSPAMIK